MGGSKKKCHYFYNVLYSPKVNETQQLSHFGLTLYSLTGEMERLQKFWLAGACTKQKVDGESSMPLGILNFTSAFILLAGGMLLGALLLLLEHVYFKFFRHKLRKWDRCGCCGLVSLVSGDN